MYVCMYVIKHKTMVGIKYNPVAITFIYNMTKTIGIRMSKMATHTHTHTHTHTRVCMRARILRSRKTFVQVYF